MRTAVLACAVLIVVFAAGCDAFVPKVRATATQPQVEQLQRELDAAKAARAQSGRWRIEMRQGVRADIYLLDTATGRVWREYEDKKVGMFWKESSREDMPQLPDGYVWDKPAHKPVYLDPATGEPISTSTAVPTTTT